MKEKTDKLITFVGLGVAILCFVLAVLFAMSNGSEVKTLADVQKVHFKLCLCNYRKQHGQEQ